MTAALLKIMDTTTVAPRVGTFNQEELLRHQRASTADLRCDIAVAIDASGDYALPRTTREGMIAEILSRPLKVDDGKLYLCWDLRMNFSWNRTGRLEDGEEVSAEHDERWNDLVENDPSIFHQACENALRPWLDEPVDLLAMDGELLCGFDLVDPCRDTLILTSFAGQDMAYPDRASFEAQIFALPDATLSNIWMACRVLDADLSQSARAEAMEISMNELRAELEEEWALDIESLCF